ncbi:electron transfer flavoprotein subunit alpha/FixB family protein [Bacilliculturomica massiliensis]|uniref:electron transfer flavoprotein subunit alpha/FixB family protein n=1 Tax=Bacilliculturomica massiliensis TaxID=1917867 RepID=UPI001FE6A6C8|nr:electron transfer flavoprotein subunit alpha/FixB family protein [Bacilliculturomica massiliensis]
MMGGENSMKNENGFGGILVIAEQCGGEIHRVSYELLNKASGLKRRPDTALDCLLLGPAGLAAQELNFRGADTVYYIQGEEFEQQEELFYKENIVDFIREKKPETVLMGATAFGRSLAPRVAAALGTGLTADCTDLQLDEDGRLIQIRPAFSDNIFAHIRTAADPQMATVRYKEFREAKRDEKLPVKIEVRRPCRSADVLSQVVENIPLGDLDISEAEVIVAAGRGVRRKEDLEMLSELAQALGGQLGVSRALVDAGMAPSARQVGYSGNRVKPKVYIACGISGAPQHLAGMKESDMIVAVNTDPSAPIFRLADYGFVGDLYEIVPQMIAAWGKGGRQADRSGRPADDEGTADGERPVESAEGGLEQ